MERQHQGSITRRRFLIRSVMTGGSIIAADLFSKSGLAQGSAPAIITSDRMRPNIPYGVVSGDITGGSTIVWSRTDRPARMIVEHDTTESFRNPKRLISREVSDASDYTARVNLSYLPPGQQIFYRVKFQDLAYSTIYSAPVTGTFRTPPAKKLDIFFAWSGDTAGQGWGINPEWGGMKIYETMRRLNPDFFIHSGDTIYADNPILAEVKLDDGSLWKNLTTPEKSKVAETLAEFRGNFAYNLLDENVRRFNAQVPQLVQWDDHETRNNWFPGQMLNDDDRYKQVKSCDILSVRAKQAFMEYMPIRFEASAPEQIYRSFNYGSSLEIFMLDERSYRGPNTPNRQTAASEETA